MTTATLADTFARKFTALSGIVHRVADEAAVPAVVEAIAADLSAERIALAGLPTALQDALATACAARGMMVMTPPYDPANPHHAIDSCQLGVTAADFAIADTATLVEASTNDAVRLVSSLPRVYIGIVWASTVTPTLRDAATLMRPYLEDNAGGIVLSFISGPSRTGDIELKLTLGVHGPETAHVILIEDAP